MIRFNEIPKIYLSNRPVDFRKGIDGFASIIQSEFELDPFQDALFIFYNRQHNKLKMLYYDGTGFWLLYKRLNKGTFKVKMSSKEEALVISHNQLQWLLQGLSMEQKRAFPHKQYEFI
jgi:transposase